MRVPVHNPVRNFLVWVVTLLLPCFALWTVLSASLAVPATGLVNLLLSNWFPELVYGVSTGNGEAILLTRFGESGGRAVPLEQADYRLGFSLNTRILSYSLAFYTTLHFATRREAYLGSYVNGIVVLYALFVAGLAILGIKELQQNLPEAFANQQAVWAPGANVVAVLYQFSILVVPSLAPVVLWFAQNRDSEVLRGLAGFGDTKASVGQGEN